jgi:hypothetical protein
MGYFWAMVLRTETPLTRELVALQRRDQMRRLRAFLSARFNALFAKSSGVDSNSGGSAISPVAPDSRL